MVHLGLIGRSIAQSRAPALHEMLGELHGVEVRYQLHDPEEDSPEAFVRTLEQMRSAGYRGCNVTYPFKQVAIAHAQEMNAAVKRVGSSNTLRFGDSIYAGNTDYTGFIRGYRGRMGSEEAGRVLLLGAGGVGRAVAFALGELGASEVLVFDLDTKGADSLARALENEGINARAISAQELPDAARSATGLVNCTPVGHYKSPGNPLPESVFGGQRWAFDAVYTPLDTEFLLAAHKQGLKIVSGFDLFFFQGIDAYEIFMDTRVDPAKLLEPFKKRFDIVSDLI
ncbi:MAG: shikimate dehydrogenase [Oceanospirillaceae bacterium]|nr:shikimate dehydrogenase [Oceanospirillaceae bacterium]